MTQPSAFREAFAPTARAMLGDVAVTGRDNAADAARIVKAIWTDERMEDVWRELHRMSRAPVTCASAEPLRVMDPCALLKAV